MKKIAKLIRSVTAPPIMAAVFIAILYAADFLTELLLCGRCSFSKSCPSWRIRYAALFRSSEREGAIRNASLRSYCRSPVICSGFKGDDFRRKQYGAAAVSSYLISGLLIAVFLCAQDSKQRPCCCGGGSDHDARASGQSVVLAGTADPRRCFLELCQAQTSYAGQLFLGAAFFSGPDTSSVCPDYGRINITDVVKNEWRTNWSAVFYV